LHRRKDITATPLWFNQPFGHVTVTGDSARFVYPSDPVLHIFERMVLLRRLMLYDGWPMDETQRLIPGEPVCSMSIYDNTLVLVTTYSKRILVYKAMSLNQADGN
jgi:hypothetical protein